MIVRIQERKVKNCRSKNSNFFSKHQYKIFSLKNNNFSLQAAKMLMARILQFKLHAYREWYYSATTTCIGLVSEEFSDSHNLGIPLSKKNVRVCNGWLNSIPKWTYITPPYLHLRTCIYIYQEVDSTPHTYTHYTGSRMTRDKLRCDT